jgi:hypothetical protein
MGRFLLAGMLLLGIARADDCRSMKKYVGYTIVAVKTIPGSFQGCEHGKAIVFEDKTYLTCSEYGYQYSFRPDAVLLVKRSQWVMIVDGTAYEMRN